MVKKYCVELSEEERKFLADTIKQDRVARHKKDKARMLLKLDQGHLGPGWQDKQVSEAFDYTVRAIERLRKKLVIEGFENILEHGNNGNSHARKLYGEEEAYLIALACDNAPGGHNRWTVRLLADKMVELNIMESCDKMTVQRALKKTNLSLT
jgi:hypothetical protein